MIRRDDGHDWLLISQVDHARLAGEIAAAWGNNETPPLPCPEWLVTAVRCHDDGWREWEGSPRIDPASGRPRDFLEMLMVEATAIWSWSIAACARVPMGSLWVSRHFQHLARLALNSRSDRDDIAALERFLANQRDVEHEGRSTAAGLSLTDEDYEQLADRGFRYVQMFDHMSLWLCCALRSKPQEFAVPFSADIRLVPTDDGSTIIIEPWPLRVDELPLTVPGRRIAASVFANDLEYRDSLDASTPSKLHWILKRRT